MCQESGVWSENESGDHLCFPSFHHIIARLFGCLEYIAKCALPHARQHTLRHSLSSGFHCVCQGLVEKLFFLDTAVFVLIVLQRTEV